MKCWHVHIRGSDSFLFIVWEQNEFLQWNLCRVSVFGIQFPPSGQSFTLVQLEHFRLFVFRLN